MKKILLSGVLLGILSVAAQADFEIGGIEFNKVPVQAKNLSVSNGGTIPDSEALRDGVGVQVMSFGSDNSVNFKAMNQALLGAEEGETLKDDKPELFVSSNEPGRQDISVKCYGAEIGSIIDGYLVVDNSTIITERDNGTDMGTLCTSNVTNMYGLFYNRTINGDITKWDTSHVTTMYAMFYKSYEFNQPIGNWDVSNVTTFYATFEFAFKFNQPLNNWDVSNATILYATFDSAYDFNQPLDKWNTSKVTNMDYMLAFSDSFDQDISMWNVDSMASGPYRFTFGADIIATHTDFLPKF